MKIYTRTGDRGETGLLDGSRVSKADPRVDAYGEVDELNAVLGIARAAGMDEELSGLVLAVQKDLFALGAVLADPSHRIATRVAKTGVDAGDIGRLEGWIDRLEAELPPLKNFILAGGSTAAAALHLARTVCRRAERRVVILTDVEPEAIAYLNRLSDLLFVLARTVNARANVPETEW